ncbi:MAG: DUF547 domain-containing protein [Polyangiales bacterium]
MMITKRLSFVLVLAACGPSGSSSNAGSASPSTMAQTPVAAGATEPEEAEAAPETPEETPEVAREAPPARPSMASWGELLQTYVNDDGFRYAALHADDEAKAKLAAAALAVGSAQDLSSWSRDERLAFLINAYNILTVHAVIERWPIEGVMEVEGFFDGIEHSVAGEQMTLNTLENERIRAVFGEPRIHFAVNCASTSCPPLRNAPFDAESLETSLEEQARAFVRSSTSLRGRRVTVSKLFEWFADDFSAGGGVREFIAARLDEEGAATVRNERTRLRYSDYDWSPNAAD